MASIRELFDSRSGASDGFHGPQGYMTMWHVTVDAEGDDPREVLLAISGGVPKRSIHPWSSEVFSDRYLAAARVAPLVHEVIVTYEVPAIIELGDGVKWDLDFDWDSESEKIDFDLDGKLVGTPIYQPVKQSDSPTHKTITVAGNTQFLKLAPTINVAGKDVQQRYPAENRERFRVRGGVRLYKSIANIPSAAMAKMRSYVTRINSDKVVVDSIYGSVFLAQEKALRLRSVRARPIEGQIAGQIVFGRVWSIEVIMEGLAEGTYPFKLRHLYKDGEGNLSPVQTLADTFEDEVFAMQREAKFVALLGLFR